MKKRKIILIFSVLMFIYILSYFVLSRYSLKLLEETEVEGFYYVPADVNLIVEHEILQKLHVFFVMFYKPIWYIDKHVFNGPDPAHIPFVKFGK